jgi:transcriptional regulator with XRE-family HTH domain
MTAAQCIEARRLLNWTQKQLAQAAGMHVTQIGHFERIGELSMARSGSNRVKYIRAALEAAGIEFSDQSGDDLGVRLREADP